MRRKFNPLSRFGFNYLPGDGWTGEADTAAQLPDAVAHTGEVWLVFNASGVWPFRKKSGLYRSAGGTWTWLGVNTLTGLSDVPTLPDSTNDYALVSVAGTYTWMQLVQVQYEGGTAGSGAATGAEGTAETGAASAAGSGSASTTGAQGTGETGAATASGGGAVSAAGTQGTGETGSAAATGSGTTDATGAEGTAETGEAVADVLSPGTALATGSEGAAETGIADAVGTGQTDATGTEGAGETGAASASGESAISGSADATGAEGMAEAGTAASTGAGAVIVTGAEGTAQTGTGTASGSGTAAASGTQGTAEAGTATASGGVPGTFSDTFNDSSLNSTEFTAITNDLGTVTEGNSGSPGLTLDSTTYQEIWSEALEDYIDGTDYNAAALFCKTPITGTQTITFGVQMGNLAWAFAGMKSASPWTSAQGLGIDSTNRVIASVIGPNVVQLGYVNTSGSIVWAVDVSTTVAVGAVVEIVFETTATQFRLTANWSGGAQIGASAWINWSQVKSVAGNLYLVIGDYYNNLLQADAVIKYYTRS